MLQHNKKVEVKRAAPRSPFNSKVSKVQLEKLEFSSAAKTPPKGFGSNVGSRHDRKRSHKKFSIRNFDAQEERPFSKKRNLFIETIPQNQNFTIEEQPEILERPTIELDEGLDEGKTSIITDPYSI